MKRMGQGRRVVVSGIGLLCPTGIGTESAWKSILAGRSGIGPVTLFDATTLPCRIAGELPGFDPLDFVGKKDVKKTSRFIQFALAATEFAIRASRINMDAETRDRVGVSVGSGVGGFEAIEREHAKLTSQGPGRVSPFFITATIVNLAAGQISIRWGAAGPNLAHATACTTGAHAIGEAYRIIQYGDADVMICGGAEAAITPLAMAGFCAMRAVSLRNDEPTRASRPSEIGYLNAHATSTPLGDRAEAAAIRKMFNDHACRVAVSSTKSMTGHLLGGAGSLEAGFTALALRDQIAPPTINLECPDIDYGLDFVPRTARPFAMRYAMTNSFRLGGGNATLIFKTPYSPPFATPPAPY